MKLTGKINDDLKGFARNPRTTRPWKTSRVWVLVADQHIARMFEKGENGLVSIGEAVPAPFAETEMADQSTGRVISSGANTLHHKYEVHMNARRQESLSFVHQVSQWLDKAVWADAFDRLVLVAPPQTLGELRKALTREVHARVIAEINKDLTKLSEEKLLENLTKIVWF